MKSYGAFIREQRPLLAFGLLLTLASSFGQTFFISLFLPDITREFELSSQAFGTLYALATLASGLLLPAAGRWIDRIPLDRFTALVLGGLGASALLLSRAEGLVLLAVALFALRLTGQGLSSHTGLTTMARYVRAGRGKALSIASLGFPTGEAVLPLLVAAALGVVGWRNLWILAGAIALLGLLPLAQILLRRARVETDPQRLAAIRASQETTGPGELDSSTREDLTSAGGSRPDVPAHRAGWTLSQVLRDLRFWLLLPAAVLPPFWATGLILYQSAVAEARGWTLTLMASAFVSFAAARVVFSLVAGPGIDRWSARTLFPWAVIPMGGGVLFLALGSAPWIAFVYMGLLGTSLGVSSNVKTALWAELYGTSHLGAIKSLDGGIMVLSTAAASLFVGTLVEAPGGMPQVLWSAVASTGAGWLLALYALRRSR